MRICYFGTYAREEGYPVNEVLIRGLRENGVDVVECHKDLWSSRTERVQSAQKGPFSWIRLAIRLCRVYPSLALKFLKIGSYDAVIVGYPGHLDFFPARILNNLRARKPLLINLLFSLHDTMVQDRKLAPPDSLLARLLWKLDRRICLKADRVILDTQAHIDFFREKFGIPREKFIRVPVGADNALFSPAVAPPSAPRRETRVLFFGSYIPLHGIETILRAASELKTDPGIAFTLIGSGQTYEEMRTLSKALDLTHVTFISTWVGYTDLARHISDADICLGIFGTTEKARRVIPCKVYNCLAMGRPVVTGDTPAAREFLVNGVHAALCPPGDPHALADAIRKLRNDPRRREEIGRAGQALFRNHFTPARIGHGLKQVIEDLPSSF